MVGGVVAVHNNATRGTNIWVSLAEITLGGLLVVSTKKASRRLGVKNGGGLFTDRRGWRTVKRHFVGWMDGLMIVSSEVVFIVLCEEHTKKPAGSACR